MSRALRNVLLEGGARIDRSVAQDMALLGTRKLTMIACEGQSPATIAELARASSIQNLAVQY